MQIKWDVFTQEERAKIDALLAAGQVEQIAHAITVDDQEKEFWLNRLVDIHRPSIAPMESEVEKEKSKFEIEGGRIESPEAEAEWQAKLDAEKLEYEKKAKELQIDREKNMLSSLVEQEAPEVPKTVEPEAAPAPLEEKPEAKSEPETESMNESPTEAPVEAPKKRGRPKKTE